METSFINIIIFAVIAGTLIWRLRGILGRRPDNENKASDEPLKRGARSNRDAQSNRDARSHRDDEEADSPHRDADSDSRADSRGDSRADSRADSYTDPHDKAYGQMQALDPTFRVEDFMGGAHAAFMMIVKAFGEGDMSEVRYLISEPVAKAFDKTIAARQSEGNVTRRILEVVEASVESARVDKQGAAFISVQFISQQTVKVPGDIEANERRVNDLWTFSRKLKSQDLAWLLVKTSSA